MIKRSRLCVQKQEMILLQNAKYLNNLSKIRIKRWFNICAEQAKKRLVETVALYCAQYFHISSYF